MGKEEETMRDLLEKWKEVEEKKKIYEARSKKYKNRIRQLLKKKGVSSLKCEGWSVKISSFIRSMITKKNVPEDVWEKYAVSIHQENVLIKPPKV